MSYGISIESSFNLIPGNRIPLQVLTKTIRSNSDFHNDPHTSEKKSQYSSCGATSHQIEFQNNATFSSSQSNRTQRKTKNPFNDFLTQ